MANLDKIINSVLFGFLLLLSFNSSQAQDDAAELAKKLSNPISSLISVPLQNNTDYGIGEMKGSRNTMNIQPVMPISISKNLNLITRLIMPVVSQYNITGEGEKQSGLSDFVLSGFFSPAISQNGITWGAGPAFLLPTGTNNYLTSKKFGIGPTAVGLKQFGGFTMGALVNQIWSVAGSDSRAAVNQMFLQPFFAYNWKSGAGLGFNFEYTQNWQSATSVVWFNPVLTGVTAVGSQKIQLGIGPRINIIAPAELRADFGWRAVIVFLFPK
jgi:hypothetical protein